MFQAESCPLNGTASPQLEPRDLQVFDLSKPEEIWQMFGSLARIDPGLQGIAQNRVLVRVYVKNPCEPGLQGLA